MSTDVSPDFFKLRSTITISAFGSCGNKLIKEWAPRMVDVMMYNSDKVSAFFSPNSDWSSSMMLSGRPFLDLKENDFAFGEGGTFFALFFPPFFPPSIGCGSGSCSHSHGQAEQLGHLPPSA